MLRHKPRARAGAWPEFREVCELTAEGHGSRRIKSARRGWQGKRPAFFLCDDEALVALSGGEQWRLAERCPTGPEFADGKRMPDDEKRPTSVPIEDYGIIGNTHTAALVSRGGSIDWLCLPRFDSESVFAALLGEPQHGRWLIDPAGAVVRRSRCYRGETGILETQFETEEGCVTLIDFMALAESEDQVDLIRLVRGDKGQVPMRTELIMRFDYGRGIPWVRQHFGGPHAVAG